MQMLAAWLDDYVEHSMLLLKAANALRRANTENSKKIFPEKELGGHRSNFHIHVSVSYLYIPKIDLPFLLQEICGPIPRIHKSRTDT
jgi:hypothetical protein